MRHSVASDTVDPSDVFIHDNLQLDSKLYKKSMQGSGRKTFYKKELKNLLRVTQINLYYYYLSIVLIVFYSSLLNFDILLNYYIKTK